MATQLLEDIYTHPQYLQALRDEVKDVLDDPLASMTNLPLLESFLVESIRTHCFLATVIHRVPLRSYTFSDGYTVPAGEIVEFYQHKMMSDNSVYPDAKRFYPERFKGTGKTSCDMGMKWPFWGNSKLAWCVFKHQYGSWQRTDYFNIQPRAVPRHQCRKVDRSLFHHEL